MGETDEKIDAAIVAYLKERAYGSLYVDGMAIAAEAGYEMLLKERDQLRGEVAALRTALTDVLGHLPSDEVLSESWQGEMMWDDIFELAKIIPKYRAALAAVPADARGEEQHDGGR